MGVLHYCFALLDICGLPLTKGKMKMLNQQVPVENSQITQLESAPCRNSVTDLLPTCFIGLTRGLENQMSKCQRKTH